MVASSAVAAGPVGVATSVDGPDGNDVVTITVPIDVVPGSPELAGTARRLARTWERQAEDGWNNAFEFFEYKCFTLRLDVDIKVRPVGFAGSDDRHRVLVATAGGGTPGFEGTKERNPSSGSKDGTRSFDGVRDGIWREDQSEAVTLHEVGHLFGLGDDYDVVVDPSTGKAVEPRQTRPKPGRAGTLMGDGGVVDQVLVDRIGKQIEKLLDGLPGCEVWEGKVTGHLTTPDCTPTEPGVDGKISLTVDRRGKVEGTAGYTTAGYTCGPVEAPPYTSPDFPVTGRKTRDAFRIQLAGEPATMEISGNRASVTFDAVGNAGYASTVTYSVKCLDCDERVG